MDRGAKVVCITLLSALLVHTGKAFAQTTISGRIADETGRAIAGATLTALCPSGPVAVTATPEGAFTLPCADVRQLKVSAPGFLPVTLDTATTRIVLHPAGASEQITVTSDRASDVPGDTAKTVYTLTSEQLRDYPSLTLDEGLRQHAGFQLFRRSSSRAANPTSDGVSLRGLGSTAVSRTLVLEDGAPLLDPFGGWVHWNENPQQTIRSATIVTGGGSDLYGSSALGGVIDVVPESPSSNSAGNSFEAMGAGGSQYTSNLQATGSHAGSHIGGLLAGESLRTGGYRSVAPEQAGLIDINSTVLSQSFRSEIGRRDLPTKRLFLTGNLLNESRNNGTPLQTNATRLWRYLGGYDAPDNGVATGRVRVFGSQEGYRQSFTSTAANRNSEALTRLQRVHTQEIGFTTDTTVRLRHVAAVFGADLRDIRADDAENPVSKNVATGLQDTTARQRFFGGFGELLGERGPWSGAISLRADRATNLDIVQSTYTYAPASATIGGQPNRTEIVLSPRAGLVRNFGQLVSIHASGFRAFRTPSMNELYRTGQVGQATTLANAALSSERGTGWEIGTKLARPSGLARLQLTYFWTIINHPVSAVLLSQTATSSISERENLGQIRSRGVEAALDLLPARPVSFTIGYQYADATVTKFSAQPSLVGNWIPQVPRHSASAAMHASRPRLGELTVAAHFSGTAYDDSSNFYSLKSSFQLDASAHHTLTHRLDLELMAQNLTDRRAQVGRTPTLTLGTPFYAQAGLRIRLGHLSR
ncbi:TonB-dependent receptor [Granulicella sp. WH15]|uniref:TonB-dependent receptor n=1 Tax=Granulicella sp. WH15 TaxID=2602070 RepID=UPI001366B454|nr:TonB-dependent receptor [Granulicella sp. WH15]QHN02047.1 TonB-dependent receptor [Granulicella sp. WH15]